LAWPLQSKIVYNKLLQKVFLKLLWIRNFGKYGWKYQHQWGRVIVGMTADTIWWQLLDNITTLGSLWFSVCCHMPK